MSPSSLLIQMVTRGLAAVGSNGVPVFLAKSNLADGRTDDGRTDGRRTEQIKANLSETDRRRLHQTETDRVGSKRSETDQIGANLSNFQFLPLLRRISEHVFDDLAMFWRRYSQLDLEINSGIKFCFR